MTAVSFRVVKLGGSLLELPGLRERLRTWLSLQSPAGTVLVIGGGPLADAIRAADDIHGLTDEVAHWLCIQAMGVTAHLAAELFPEAELAPDTASIAQVCAQGGLAILDPWSFLREEEPRASGIRLPCSWDVTSDSIAARLATLLSAELVLLKSTLPEANANLASAARTGYVDAFLPTVAASLPMIRCVDLRSDDFSTRETVLTV